MSMHITDQPSSKFMIPPPPVAIRNACNTKGGGEATVIAMSHFSIGVL